MVEDFGFFVVVDVFLVVVIFDVSSVTVTSSESDFFRAYRGGGRLLLEQFNCFVTAND